MSSNQCRLAVSFPQPVKEGFCICFAPVARLIGSYVPGYDDEGKGEGSKMGSSMILYVYEDCHLSV